MILCEMPKNEVTIFSLLVTDYLQFAGQQTLNFFSAVLPLQLQKDKWEKKTTAEDR